MWKSPGDWYRTFARLGYFFPPSSLLLLFLRCCYFTVAALLRFCCYFFVVGVVIMSQGQGAPGEGLQLRRHSNEAMPETSCQLDRFMNW